MDLKTKRERAFQDLDRVVSEVGRYGYKEEAARIAHALSVSRSIHELYSHSQTRKASADSVANQAMAKAIRQVLEVTPALRQASKLGPRLLAEVAEIALLDSLTYPRRRS